MNGGSTTAAETTSDTQAETETKTKEGTSIRSQMIKNAKAYLALDEDFERQETESLEKGKRLAMLRRNAKSNYISSIWITL